MSERIPIYAVITPSHRVLYDRFFLPSLDQESFELFAIDLEQEGKGEFLADDFKRCILFKIEQIIASIKRHHGKIILWSDVDIQFFGLTAERLLQPFADKELQFAIQRLLAVGDEGCGGFYALRCNEQMLAFFESVLHTTVHETRGNEQDAINVLLRRPLAPKWAFLGPEYYARTHGVWLPSDAVIHHATCIVAGDAVKQKVKLLEDLSGFDQWTVFRLGTFRITSVFKALLRRLGLRIL